MKIDNYYLVYGNVVQLVSYSVLRGKSDKITRVKYQDFITKITTWVEYIPEDFKHIGTYNQLFKKYPELLL